MAEERKCKMCVCVTGGTKGVLPMELCYIHTLYTLSFCGHTKSTQKYNIDSHLYNSMRSILATDLDYVDSKYLFRIFTFLNFVSLVH